LVPSVREKREGSYYHFDAEGSQCRKVLSGRGEGGDELLFLSRPRGKKRRGLEWSNNLSERTVERGGKGKKRFSPFFHAKEEKEGRGCKGLTNPPGRTGKGGKLLLLFLRNEGEKAQRKKAYSL